MRLAAEDFRNFSRSFFSGKQHMRQLGIIANNTMARPQRHLNAEETSKVDAILKATGLLG